VGGEAKCGGFEGDLGVPAVVAGLPFPYWRINAKTSMKQVLQSIKQHPYSVSFYLIYCWMWYGTYKVILHPIRDGGFLVFSGMLTAMLFIIVSLFNAYHSNQYKFYLWVIGFIVIPVAIAFYLGCTQAY